MKKIYMAQPNSRYGNSIYFPYAAASLIAYAFKDSRISGNFQLESFLYKKTDIAEAVESFSSPFLVGFSCYVWNYEYNKALAKKLKELYPSCITVFGGHQINKNSSIVDADFVDYCIFGEGEEAFRKLLLSLIGEESAENIPNIAFRKDGQTVFTPTSKVTIPERVSPYLEGYFDSMLQTEELEFSAILETNRGCPNKCAFCDWGNEKSRVKLYDIETVKAEIDWISRNRIEYCYCADANFGLFERDKEIIDYIYENGVADEFNAGIYEMILLGFTQREVTKKKVNFSMK